MSNELRSRSAQVVRGLVWAGIVASPVTGALGLLGWSLDHTARSSAPPGLIDLAPSTALGLILGGVALGLLRPVAPGNVRGALGRACAAGMAAVGVTLLLHSLGPELVRSVLAGPWTREAAWSPPDSPGMTATALCFVLLGGALLQLGRCPLFAARWTGVLTVPALLITLLVFNGLLHGALVSASSLDVQSHTGMGLQTTVVLLLLGIGALCARPERGLMIHVTQHTLGGYLARRLVPVTLLGPLLFSVLLEVLVRFHLLVEPLKTPLFSTVASMGGVGLVLISTAVLDRIDREREQHLARLRDARAEAERERMLLQTVVDSAPVGILFVDPDTDKVRTNVALMAMLGRSPIPSDGREQSLGNFLHPDGRVASPEEFPSTRALAGQTVPAQEFLIARADRQIPVLASAAPVFGASAKVRGVVVTLQDITARWELERLQKDYVGLISHDLRNPLQIIVLRTELLQRMLQEKGLTREASIAGSLLQNAQQMGGMVQELLENSRLEAGQVELHRKPTDLVRFIEEVLERDIPPDSRERFRLELSAEVPLVPVDPPRLERVMVNLITNALKYSPPGTPIEIRMERTEARVEISVRDHGVGLRPEETVRLFQKYYRAQGGRQGKGIGLGLYICRLIVEAHGGDIRVDSLPDHGSTFTLALPLNAPAHESRGAA